MISASVGPGPWRDALAERGLRSGALQAALERGWLVLRCPPGGRRLDALSSDADWPGPWRLIPVASGLVRVFELPPAIVAGIDRAPEELELARAAIDWALATLADPVAPVAPVAPEAGAPVAGAPGARAPAGTPAAWTVRSGTVVAQVREHPSAAGPVLELPLCARPVASLGASRGAWMRAILLDARARWRLVRCLAGDGGPSARIDLRGAPPALAESLSAAALDALRQLGARLLEPLDLVLDPDLDSRTLAAGGFEPDRPSPRARPAPTRRARPASSPIHKETSHGPLDPPRP